MKSTHIAHCCPVHGCKYALGKTDEQACPVANGSETPAYPHNNGCEACDTERDADDLYAEVLETFGIRICWNVGIKHQDGSVTAVSVASYSRREIAEQRVSEYNKERELVVEGSGPYVVVKQYVSDWMEA